MRRRHREKNFLNDPETWELLQKIHALAEPWGLTLLPEIYQVNATYYSALGESDEKMLLARAIQMFMPGKPQIWYLDLFAGKNDHEAVQRAGESGHKEINRTNLSVDQIAEGLKKDVVQKQLALIRMRNTHKAFSEGAEVTISGEESSLEIRWEYDGAYAELHVNFEEGTYTIESN